MLRVFSSAGLCLGPRAAAEWAEGHERGGARAHLQCGAPPALAQVELLALVALEGTALEVRAPAHHSHPLRVAARHPYRRPPRRRVLVRHLHAAHTEAGVGVGAGAGVGVGARWFGVRVRVRCGLRGRRGQRRARHLYSTVRRAAGIEANRIAR